MQDNESRSVVQAADSAATQDNSERSDRASDAGGAEVMPGLEQLLKQAELAAQEHHDAWLRAKAEAENIRKRSQTEVANAHKYALEGFAQELLPVRDSLEAALDAGSGGAEALRSGVELTLKQLDTAFAKVNISEINPLGEKLDPHKHHAINTMESDAEPNTVVKVLQKGYELHDRVIRPALVSVAKSKDA